MPRLHGLKVWHGPRKVFNKNMIDEAYWEPKKNIASNKISYHLIKKLFLIEFYTAEMHEKSCLKEN